MISSKIAQAFANPELLLEQWLDEQLGSMKEAQNVDAQRLREQSRELLRLLREACERAPGTHLDADAWGDVRQAVARVATIRAKQGFLVSDTATFVFALKRPLFRALRAAHDDMDALFEDVWSVTLLLDGLGLIAMEAQADVAENVIARQRSELMELSTPVLQLWDGLLVMPLIGTLDSHRAQLATETLLDTVMRTGSEVVLIDIQGVPTVDTLVAQHLLKTVKALRLMGAEGIVSGIGPQIAQTMVQLGIDLGSIETCFGLAGGLRLALRRLGMRVLGPASKPDE